MVTAGFWAVSAKPPSFIQTPQRNPISTVYPIVIEVVLPQVTPKPIKALDVNVQNYQLNVEDMGQIAFESVSLRTTLGKILLDVCVHELNDCRVDD